MESTVLFSGWYCTKSFWYINCLRFSQYVLVSYLHHLFFNTSFIFSISYPRHTLCLFWLSSQITHFPKKLQFFFSGNSIKDQVLGIGVLITIEISWLLALSMKWTWGKIHTYTHSYIHIYTHTYTPTYAYMHILEIMNWFTDISNFNSFP